VEPKEVTCRRFFVALQDPARGVLLLWRHRFITDTWGWEVPAGRVEPGESPAEAAEREAVEETGWRPVGLRSLFHYQPTNGLSDQKFHLFLSAAAEHVGEPTDVAEAERIEWVSTGRLASIAQSGEMLDGLSLTAVLYVLAFGLLA
jgi:8-oxo-dGTP pyrophosphatase MutT (NUDIX family)